MGLFTVKTSGGFDKIAQQVVILPEDHESCVTGVSIYNAQRLRAEVVVPYVGTLLRGFYLNKNVSGSRLTIPEMTVGYVHVSPTQTRDIQPWAIIEVPLDSRAKTYDTWHITSDDHERLANNDSEAALKSLIVSALLLTADELALQQPSVLQLS